MKMNHLHLTVSNVPATKAFLQKYFGLKSLSEGEASKNFDALIDDDGLVLTLMKTRRGAEVKYPGYFHIGFMQESEEQVNELNHRLKADGFEVDPPQRSHAWTFYVEAPGGFLVEVLC